MTEASIILLVVATALLFVGHVARAVRWALLFPPRKLSTRFDLLVGLSLGYLFNAIFPGRLGELFRAYFVSVRGSVDFSYVAATVVVERLSDLYFVSTFILMLFFLHYPTNDMLLGLGILLMVSSFLATVLIVAVRHSMAVRKLLWSLCSVFNDSIRSNLIEFVWNITEIAQSSKVLGRSYLIATLIMWLVYGSSYFIFGMVVSATFDESILAVFSSPLLPLILNNPSSKSWPVFEVLFYSTIPILVIIIYGLTRQWSEIVRDFSLKLRFGGSLQGRNPNSARDKFQQVKEFDYFLASHFGGGDKVLSSFSLLGIEDGSIVRLYNGGSDAITALVEVNERLIIRKFAVGAAAVKLKSQSTWLRSHQKDNIPLVEIISDQQGEFYYRYDMPLIASANEYYDFIHTVHIDQSKALLTDVVEAIAEFHFSNGLCEATKETVELYLAEKVVKNVQEILEFARRLIPDQEFEINGSAYSFSDWNCLLDIEWLSSQINHFQTCTIHGDLTVENIIVVEGKVPAFYIIDPNPDNVFDSPLIDFGKLMQSLHLGYESLNRSGQRSSVSGSAIAVKLSRSHAYSVLHQLLEERILHQYGPETLKEVYFHELINYLRLTPYKIRKDPAIGLTFFACTCILLARYLQASKLKS